MLVSKHFSPLTQLCFVASFCSGSQPKHYMLWLFSALVGDLEFFGYVSFTCLFSSFNFSSFASIQPIKMGFQSYLAVHLATLAWETCIRQPQSQHPLFDAHDSWRGRIAYS